MGYLIEKLGASNESEIFTGIMLDNSQYKQQNHIENFYILSQINLMNLYEKFLGIYQNLDFFGDLLKFEENLHRIACSTYTIVYYFVGCYANFINDNIMKKLKEFKENHIKGNNIYLGLPWMMFSNVFLDIKTKGSLKR